MPARDNTLRTLIWTPDASRALAAIGNAPDAFGQIWHLSCGDDRPTCRQFVSMACEIFGTKAACMVIGRWALIAAGLFSRRAREIGNCCRATSRTTGSIRRSSSAGSRTSG